MDTKEMTPAEFLQLYEQEDGEAPHGFTCVEDGHWVQEHKYQHATNVYRCDTTGRHFAVHLGRSGSYHSDWYYDDPDCNEVWPVTRTVTYYVAKKPEAANG